MYHQAGDRPKAVAVAREAVPLCLERGNLRLAAELYRVMRAHLKYLDLGRDQLHAIGGELREMKDWKNAANIYAFMLRREPREMRAIKAMLQIADVMLHREDVPDEAHRVYSFLLKQCSDSTLADFMRAGQAEAERRLDGVAALT